MANVSRNPREHWLKTHFLKNEVANSGYITLPLIHPIVLPRHHHLTQRIYEAQLYRAARFAPSDRAYRPTTATPIRTLRQLYLNRKEPECLIAAFWNIAPAIRQLRLPLHLQPRHKRIPRTIGRMAEKNLCLLCSVSNHISMGLPLYCFFKFSTFLIQFLNTRISFYCLIGFHNTF